jgi:peptidyl-prolyl cis-trans isomerase D
MSVLDRLRSGSDSTWLQIILVAVVISFVYYGKQRGDGREGYTVATVNGHAIIDEEFKRALRSSGSREESEQDSVRQRVLDQLVREEAVQQEAARLGVYASDGDLAERLLRNPAFHNEKGEFDTVTYQDALKRYRITQADFEASIRKEIVVSKLQRLLQLGGIATADEVQDAFVHNQTNIDISYVRIPPNRFLDDVDLSEAAVSAFVTANKERIATSYKEDFERLFKLPEKAQLSVIKLAVKADGVTIDELKARVEKIRGEITSGADFAEIARRHSEDGATAMSGGDMGTLEVANLPSEVATAIQGLAIGALSAPIFGTDQVRLYKVIAREAAREVPLAEAEPEIAKRLLREEKGPKLATEFAEKVRAEWATGGHAPEALLSPKGVLVQETSPFQPDSGRIPGGLPADLVKDAGTATVGAALPRVYESGGIYYVAALHDRQQPDMALFEKEKDHITETILQMRRGALWESYVDALVKRSAVTTNLPGAKKPEPEAPGAPEAPKTDG